MSGVNKVAAEPRMDDLLASIRRAIHDEGLDVSEATPSVQKDLHREIPKTPRLAPPSERALPPDVRRPAQRPVENRTDDSREIVALRNKISRELSKDGQASKAVMLAAPKLQPVLQAATETTQSVFRSLLGGSPQPVQPSLRVEAQKPPQTKADPAGELAEKAGLQVSGRPSVLPIAPRRPPAQPARTALDEPHRNDEAIRPPFGQSTLGIRSFRPPVREAEEGIVSAETSTMTASSFNRLAEEMFGREGGERSIDDLAQQLLYPMLKEWLDQNLASIVERLVREEIERLARRGGR